MTYDPELQKREWARPPIGGRNVSSREIANMPLEAISVWVDEIWNDQYSLESNFDGGYRRHLGLDSTTGRTVMDFGCGFGFDALSYARAGNRVILVDVVEPNLAAATKVLLSKGFGPMATVLFPAEPPFNVGSGRVDVFHASGVLHHTPHAPEILRWAASRLAPGGEMRLMLYTDHQFRTATGAEPGDVGSDVAQHPDFGRYVRWCDAVGHYADWYTFERLSARLPDGWYVASWNYLKPDRGNAVAVVRRRNR